MATSLTDQNPAAPDGDEGAHRIADARGVGKPLEAVPKKVDRAWLTGSTRDEMLGFPFKSCFTNAVADPGPGMRVADTRP